MQLYTVLYYNNFCHKWYFAITKTSIISYNIMFKSHTILNFVWESYDALLCLLFKNVFIAEKEIKMLELETMFMLLNAALYEYGLRFSLPEYGPSMSAKIGKALFRSIFEKSWNFRTKAEKFWTLII